MLPRAASSSSTLTTNRHSRVRRDVCWMLSDRSRSPAREPHLAVRNSPPSIRGTRFRCTPHPNLPPLPPPLPDSAYPLLEYDTRPKAQWIRLRQSRPRTRLKRIADGFRTAAPREAPSLQGGSMVGQHIVNGGNCSSSVYQTLSAFPICFTPSLLPTYSVFPLLSRPQ